MRFSKYVNEQDETAIRFREFLSPDQLLIKIGRKLRPLTAPEWVQFNDQLQEWRPGLPHPLSPGKLYWLFGSNTGWMYSSSSYRNAQPMNDDGIANLQHKFSDPHKGRLQPPPNDPVIDF
jgi:hypothetical protein